MLSRRLLRTKVLRSLYSHFTSGRTRIETSIAEYNKGVEKCHELHILVLLLLVDLVRYAGRRQEVAAAKMLPTAEDLNPNRRFVDNSVIAKLADNDNFVTLVKASKLTWADNEQVVKEIFGQIMASAQYSAYLAGRSDDRSFIVEILSLYFEDNEVLCEALEDMSIFWVDDLGYAISQAIKTIESIAGKGSGEQVWDMYRNDDDAQFGQRLMLDAIANIEGHFVLIDQLTQNWELERIAYMDRLILAQAISEITSCPTIPVKVTLDEYIEISKYYSTSSSSTFINGVLNRAVQTLSEAGRVNKTGRGLVEG